MTIQSKIDDIMNLVQDKEPAITKTEMQELLDGKTEEKEKTSYRQVSEKPVVVDIMDISDAAAKKLATIMSNQEQNVQVAAQDEPDSKPTSIIGKLMGFAKDIFIKILKVIGHAIGWVVGTLTSLLSQLSEWVLKRIQAAVVISITKSMSGSMGRMGRFGGKMAFLKQAMKFGGGAAAIMAGVNMLQGFDKVDSQLDSINSQTQAVFASPESMITAGAASMPSFSDLGSGTPGGGASGVTGGGGGGGGGGSDMAEDEDTQDDVDELSDQLENPPTLEGINTELELPPPDPRDEEPESEEPVTQTTDDKASEEPVTQTADDKAAETQLTNAGMFAGAEQLQPQDTLGATMAGLEDSIKNMNQSIDISMSQTGGDTTSAGGSSTPPATSMPSMSSPSGSMSKPQSISSPAAMSAPASTAVSAPAGSAPAGSPVEDLATGPPEQAVGSESADINIKSAGDQIAPLLATLEQVPQQFESAMDAGMSSSDKLSTTSSSAKPATGSMASAGGAAAITKPPASIAASPAPAASSPRSTIAPPSQAQVASTTNEAMAVNLKETTDKTTQVLDDLKTSLANRQTNIVTQNKTETTSVTDFITSTEQQKSQTRNTSFST